MRRKTYRQHELKAGKTIFIVTRTLLDHFGAERYSVDAYLIASKCEPQPDPRCVHPYRMHPDVAKYAGTVTDLWRTKRAALREAARRQALSDAQISRRGA